MTIHNPIFFKIFKGISDNMLANKPYFIFKEFRNILTDPDLTTGVDRMIYANQDTDGNITLPKGFYKIHLEFDFNFTNVNPEINFPGKTSYLVPNLKFFVDNVEINDRPIYKMQCKNNTIPPIFYPFAIKNDIGKFRMEMWPTIFVESKEELAFKFNFKNIVIIIERIVEIQSVETQS